MMNNKKKFPMSISVDNDVQSKLQAYAMSRNMSVSAVISEWVNSLNVDILCDSKDAVKMKDLARILNYGFCVTVIDFEYVLYKDLGNDFNVEISGLLRERMPKDVNELMANIYLWHGMKIGECRVVASAYHVDFENIIAEVEAMYDYSNKHINDNYIESYSSYRNNDNIEPYRPVYGIDGLCFGSLSEIRKQVKRIKEIQSI